MNLQDLQQHWDAFGRRDPMWAILTDPARKGRRWTAAEFFATGAEEIAALHGRGHGAWLAQAPAAGPRLRVRPRSPHPGAGRLRRPRGRARRGAVDDRTGPRLQPARPTSRVPRAGGAAVCRRCRPDGRISSIPAACCSTSPPNTPAATSANWRGCSRPADSCRSTCQAARSRRRPCRLALCPRRPIAPRSPSRIVRSCPAPPATSSCWACAWPTSATRRGRPVSSSTSATTGSPATARWSCPTTSGWPCRCRSRRERRWH